MKVLLLAPHPFYQSRGTPIAVDLLLQTLGERGDQVDVLTFHEGADRTYDNVRIFRIRPLIRVSGVRPGFSMKKLYCDFHLFLNFLSLMRRGNYDLVHAVEESAFMALLVCRLRNIPFVYDMDSSMSTQLVNRFAVLRPVAGMLRWLESGPIRSAAVVVPMCDALADEAQRAGAKDIVVLKDVSLLGTHPDSDQPFTLRDDLGIDTSQKIVMYIGNLEPYQGIDLMLESIGLVSKAGYSVSLVVIGGDVRDIEKYRETAQRLGIADSVYFLGPRPVDDIGHYMAQADVLLSPRLEGVNTPMKIYSYLDSGVPVVATDLPTHTQVMSHDTAMLAAPEKDAFAEAIIRLIENEPLGEIMANRARDMISREHSYPVFKRNLQELYRRLELQYSR